MSELHANARAAAQCFRLGQESRGHALFAKVVEQISAKPALVASMGAVLTDLLAAQERGDVLRMADVLEFVIGPRLG